MNNVQTDGSAVQGGNFRSLLNEVTSQFDDDDWREAAEAWGIPFKQLAAWIGNTSKSRFPAEYLVPLCMRLGHFRLLDQLEYGVQRIALQLPGPLFPSEPSTFRDVLRQVIDAPKNRQDGLLLAKRLGTDYRQLRFFVSHGSSRHFPAEFVVPLCQQLHDLAPLDFLELQAGRLAFPLPPLRPLGMGDVADIHTLLQESLDAVRIALKSVGDGHVDIREARSVIAELDVVVRHCLRMRQWLTSSAFG